MLQTSIPKIAEKDSISEVKLRDHSSFYTEFKKFPIDSLWCLFIDGKRQAKEQWVGFEKKETGYLKGMFEAFTHMLSDLGKPITEEMILNYHALATTPVEIKRLTPELKGKYRTKNVGMWLTENNTNLQGVIELINKMVNGQSHFLLARDGVTVCDEMEVYSLDIINSNTIEFYIKDKIEFLKRKSVEGSPEQLKKIAIKQLAKLIIKSSYRFSSQQKKEYSFTDDKENFQKTKITPKIMDDLSRLVRESINQYHSNIAKAVTQDQKLRIIVNTIQELEQTHPFNDANCRLFVMLILNKLLVENGFTFCILEDPNCFDFYSVESLCDEVIKGMQRFKLLFTEIKDDAELLPEFQPDPTQILYYSLLLSKTSLEIKQALDPYVEEYPLLTKLEELTFSEIQLPDSSEIIPLNTPKDIKFTV